MQEYFYLEVFNNVVTDAYAVLRRHEIVSVLAMTTNLRPLPHPGLPHKPCLSSPRLDGRAAHSDGFSAMLASNAPEKRLPNGPLRFAECRGTG
jgi:hypothetical protein